MQFETKWSGAGNGSIYSYNDSSTIKTIALADGNTIINEFKDGSVYDSRSRNARNGEILILEITNGHFAAIKIIYVQYKSGMGTRNDLTFDR